MRGGSTPDFESDKIYSPTKLSIFLSAFVFLLDFLTAFPSAFLSIDLPPAFLPALRLVLSFHFIYSSPFSLLFFLLIYSPTPFTVRRQGGLLDPPDTPSRTPLLHSENHLSYLYKYLPFTR